MTIEIVEERLDMLLSTEHARVLLLTGGWGAGKTFQWKQALHRASVASRVQRYAYVSLFGLTSLAEVRKRIAEETVSAMKIPGKASTVGNALEEDGWRLKPLQILKLLPVIPYIGKLEGLASELSFASVRNAVICLDDLERGGNGLRVADVFGLASFLKEERSCKIVLISNHEKLDEDGLADMKIYLEKVVDETVHVAPTSTEASRIALGESPDRSRSLLRERVAELGIANIRVISRLSKMAAELEVILEGLNDRVLEEGIKSLTLFGAALFLPSDGFPPVDHLMKLGSDWAHFFRNAKRVEEETDEDRNLVAWGALLDRYGYGATSLFDAEIGRGVQRGYFDRVALVPLAQHLSSDCEHEALRSKFHAGWSKFWHSIDGDGAQMLRELRDLTMESLQVIGPGDLQPVFEVFSQAGFSEVADDLLEQFITRNQHRPGVFEVVEGSFRDSFVGAFADRLRSENDRHKAKPSIEESLDAIDFDRGWNHEDIRVVGRADLGEIESLLRNTEGARFRARLRTLLRIGTLPDAQEDEKRVSELTLNLLRSLARDDPILAIRIRHYLPTDLVR